VATAFFFVAVLPAPMQAQVVAPEVREALTNQASVPVIIILTVGSADRSQLEADVALVQDRFLSALPPGALQNPRRFRSVPGLAGDLTLEGLEVAANLPQVAMIGIDEEGEGLLAQSVPLTNADLTQQTGFTGQGVTVAVLDSGIDTDHPDLSDDLVGENCFCARNGACCPNGMATQSGAGAAEDDQGHGTWVSGQITSGGAVAPVGMAPNASIVAIKVLDSTNTGLCSDAVLALEDVRDNWPQVNVVNMSLGFSPLSPGDCDAVNNSCITALVPVLQDLWDAGVTVFASSGNDGDTVNMRVPACISTTLSVGAVYDANVGTNNFGTGSQACTDNTTAADQVTCYSCTNEKTDLLAPGTCISSSSLGGGVGGCGQGTSASSPHAAGCAALVLEPFPGLTPQNVRDLLTSTGVPILDSRNNEMIPRIDCLAALCDECDPITLNVNPPAPADLECDQPGGMPSNHLSLQNWAEGATSSGSCGVAIDIAWETDDFLAVSCSGNESHDVDFTATHACGDEAEATGQVTIVDTMGPQVEAPTAITAECNVPEGRLKTDPAIASFLNDAEILDFCDAAATLANDAPDAFPWGCAPGQVTGVVFTGTDACGNTGDDDSAVRIVDSTAPVPSAPDPLTVECTTEGGIPADDPAVAAWLNEFAAVDVCDTTVDLSNDAPALFPAGCGSGQETVVTATASDDCSNTVQFASSLTVEDTTPPDVVVPEVLEECLWPPNHKYVCFDDVSSLSVITDICDDDITVTVECQSNQCDDAACDEYPEQQGDGNTTDDCFYDEDTDQICMRAERAGNHAGDRIYTVLVSATDSCGNETADVQVMEVTVPKNGSQASDCIHP